MQHLGGSVHCPLLSHFSNALTSASELPLQTLWMPKTLEQKSQKIIAGSLCFHFFNISPRSRCAGPSTCLREGHRATTQSLKKSQLIKSMIKRLRKSPLRLGESKRGPWDDAQSPEPHRPGTEWSLIHAIVHLIYSEKPQPVLMVSILCVTQGTHLHVTQEDLG